MISLRIFKSLLKLVPPILQELSVSFLLGIDLLDVLNFGQLSSSLFVHLLLNLPSLLSVPLINLLQNVALVVLSNQCLLGSLLFSKPISLLKLSINQLLLIVYKPVFFVLNFLLELDSLKSGIIDILHEIDSGLFFSLPLVLSHFPLLL